MSRTSPPATPANIRVELDKLQYIAGHRFILITTSIIRRLAFLVGAPLLVLGTILGNWDLVRLGLLSFAAYVLCLMAGVAVLLPGVLSIDNQGKKKQAE